jgi:hypothetical protein
MFLTQCGAEVGLSVLGIEDLIHVPVAVWRCSRPVDVEALTYVPVAVRR